MLLGFSRFNLGRVRNFKLLIVGVRTAEITPPWRVFVADVCKKGQQFCVSMQSFVLFLLLLSLANDFIDSFQVRILNLVYHEERRHRDIIVSAQRWGSRTLEPFLGGIYIFSVGICRTGSIQRELPILKSRFIYISQKLIFQEHLWDVRVTTIILIRRLESRCGGVVGLLIGLHCKIYIIEALFQWVLLGVSNSYFTLIFW